MSSPTYSITPYDIAKAMYETKGWDFQKDMEAFSRGGYVLSTPRYFIFADIKPDHWYVHICVGHGAPNFFISIMPEYRPLIAFSRGMRDGKLKFYNTERLKRLCVLQNQADCLKKV